MKKIHTYSVMFYTRGGWLKKMLVEASTQSEAISITRKKYDFIEMYRVRFID